MKYKVLVSAPYMQKDIDNLRPIFAKNNIIVDLPKVKERLSEDDLLAVISNYDGVICGDDAFTAKVFDKANKLKVIAKWGTGIDSIDLAYAKKIGIRVYNTPNAFTNPVADTVMGFILVFARNIPWISDAMKTGVWHKIEGYSLSEKTLGIIGLGNIGQAVAKRAHSFGMNIVGNDIKKVSQKIIDDYGVEMMEINRLLDVADYISLNCDLNRSSHHLISEKQFQLMKKSAIVINTSRGGVINESDLVNALKKKYIAGAALDVFEEEPLPQDSPLRKLNNIILSPHNANSSPYYYKKVHENSINKLFEGLKIKK